MQQSIIINIIVRSNIHTANSKVSAVSTLRIYLVSQYYIFILGNTPHLCRHHAIKSSNQNNQFTSLVVGVSYTFILMTFLDVSCFTDYNIVHAMDYLHIDIV